MTEAGRYSAFNFCNPFDHVLPVPGTLTAPDRLHLWGLYSDISAANPSGFKIAWTINSNKLLGGM